MMLRGIGLPTCASRHMSMGCRQAGHSQRQTKQSKQTPTAAEATAQWHQVPEHASTHRHTLGELWLTSARVCCVDSCSAQQVVLCVARAMPSTRSDTAGMASPRWQQARMCTAHDCTALQPAQGLGILIHIIAIHLAVAQFQAFQGQALVKVCTVFEQGRLCQLI